MIRGFIKLAIVILVLGYLVDLPFSRSSRRVSAGVNRYTTVSESEHKESGKTEVKKKKRKVRKAKINRKKVKIDARRRTSSDIFQKF